MNVQQKIRATSFIDDQTLSVLEKVALVLASSALIVLSGKIMVPFWPVAMTMQTFAVIALGVVLGPRLALAAALSWFSSINQTICWIPTQLPTCSLRSRLFGRTWLDAKLA
jgi:predicted membrane protein